MSSHLVTVKEPNLSVPGRGIVADETTLLVDERQLRSFNRGPLFGSGKLQYAGPGMILKPIDDLTDLAPATVAASQQVNYDGFVTGFGIVHTPAPTTTDLDVVLGITVGDTAAYAAPPTNQRLALVEAGYNPTANWLRLAKPIPFKKGQYVVMSCVTDDTAYVSGSGTLVAVLGDKQNAYSAYS